MSKRLILMRHTKSSWNTPLDDHARPLNGRGQRSADALGAWLAAGGYVPDAIYTSDAARTVETTGRLVAAMGASPEVTWMPSLYLAAPETLLTTVQSASEDTIAVIAHNPGIAFLAEGIVATAPDHPRFLDYPTGATLVCDFAIEKWADASPASAHVVDFIVPRDLLGE